MLHSFEQALLIFLMALGLIAFRLLWANPLTDKLMICYLPKSWQDWLLDKPHPFPKKGH